MTDWKWTFFLTIMVLIFAVTVFNGTATKTQRGVALFSGTICAVLIALEWAGVLR